MIVPQETYSDKDDDWIDLKEGVDLKSSFQNIKSGDLVTPSDKLFYHLKLKRNSYSHTHRDGSIFPEEDLGMFLGASLTYSSEDIDIIWIILLHREKLIFIPLWHDDVESGETWFKKVDR